MIKTSFSKKQNESIDDKIEAFVSNIDTLNIRIRDLRKKLALIDCDNTENVEDEKTSEFADMNDK